MKRRAFKSPKQDDDEQRKPAATTTASGSNNGEDQRGRQPPRLREVQVGGIAFSAFEVPTDETHATLTSRIAAEHALELAARQLLPTASLYQAAGLTQNDITAALTGGRNTDRMRTATSYSAAAVASAASTASRSSVAGFESRQLEAVQQQQLAHLLAGQLLTSRIGPGSLLASTSTREQPQHQSVPPFASMPERTTSSNATLAGSPPGMAGRTGLEDLLASTSTREQPQHQSVPPFASMPERTTLSNATLAGNPPGMAGRTGLEDLLSSISRAQQRHQSIPMPSFASMPERTTTTLTSPSSAVGAGSMAGTGGCNPDDSLLTQQRQQQQQQQDVVSRPAPQDVLLGRGKPIQEHPGNEAMRALVQQHKDRYNRMPRDRRGLVANELISQLQNSGSRFLKRDEFYSNGWIHASESEVYEKFCHSLRSRPRANRNRNNPR